MNNLKQLILDPRQYFLESENKIIENKKTVRLTLLILTYSVVQIISVIVSNNHINYLLNSIVEIPKILTITFEAFTLPIYLLGIVLSVNIYYFIIKNLVIKYEKKNIEDAKYLKKILYVINIIPKIIFLLATILNALVVKNHQILLMMNSVSCIFAGIIYFYMLYNLLKFYLKTEKLYKILPIIVYIFNVIDNVGIILKA
ncbi:hypothetical protein QOZ84_09345 [Romboutsia sedimentorum]|uniref:Yip1 domain-containing protein n=1 Tax=Romboutsia sedimentorum TaxID=1368474 RepID=A0ABT7ECG2_9FIRM|nr:hypothetical protein [Romboutsia sedimentorum]MDK2563753.1 hypothetical protein [Romboutsia sedimentorum]